LKCHLPKRYFCAVIKVLKRHSSFYGVSYSILSNSSNICQFSILDSYCSSHVFDKGFHNGQRYGCIIKKKWTKDFFHKLFRNNPVAKNPHVFLVSFHANTNTPIPIKYRKSFSNIFHVSSRYVLHSLHLKKKQNYSVLFSLSSFIAKYFIIHTKNIKIKFFFVFPFRPSFCSCFSCLFFRERLCWLCVDVKN
jgi:hypothetical protein